MTDSRSINPLSASIGNEQPTRKIIVEPKTHRTQDSFTILDPTQQLAQVETARKDSVEEKVKQPEPQVKKQLRGATKSDRILGRQNGFFHPGNNPPDGATENAEASSASNENDKPPSGFCARTFFCGRCG